MQATSVVLMVRPVRFGFNAQTAESNAFQQESTTAAAAVQDQALQEFNAMVELLRKEGVEVLVLADRQEPHCPDSIFPNNWISFHQEQGAVLYPMEAQNRRLERRADLAEWLQQQGFAKFSVHDMSAHERKGLYLEGTGSMVLDRVQKQAFACLSSRTNFTLLQEWCHHLGYEPVVFTAADAAGKPVYHTNVLLAIGEKVAILCAEAIAPEDQERVIQKLSQNGRELVTITLEQMGCFAGNMLELLSGSRERLLVLSAQARASLKPEQLEKLSCYNRLICPNIPTIEQHGGGSVRCMMAEVFLPR